MKRWWDNFPFGTAATSGTSVGAASVVLGLSTDNPQALVSNFPCGFMLGFALIAIVYTWAYLMDEGK